MSARGKSRKSAPTILIFVKPPKAEVQTHEGDVRYVLPPQPDICCDDLSDNCALGNLSGFMGTWDVVGDEGVGFVREAGHNGCSMT